MIKIWGRANSINVQKALWTVEELSIPYERIDAGLQYGVNNEDWFGDLNPNRTIPTIEDGDFILWESNVIVRYLAEHYGPEGFYPTAPQQKALMEQWMDWQQTTVMLDLGPLFLSLVRTAEEDRDQGLVERTAENMQAHMAILNNHLSGRDFILGSEMTCADIPLGAVAYRWYALNVAHSDFPALQAWYNRLQDSASYREQIMLPLS